MLITVHTDGSSDNTTGLGSYGYVITAKHRGKNVMKKHSSKKYADTTNNRMELKAIIKALESIDVGHKIDIYSDSQYCVKGANEWLHGWLAKGKLHTKMNADLWERLLEAQEKHRQGGSTLNLTWVRGHNGNTFNEIADKLAEVGRLSQQQPISCKKNN
ncbi:Rnase H [Croceibacter phage P2559S]|uniref:Rnase H n=1 Tax=Croceibacter phage P2559S TaxID=1176422 RepID=UPI0002688EBC|nr:Rnase H [Croceibacter phage P2559S]AFM54811.1 ribonuclease H [Croceibacter phage P2559S]